MADFTDIVSEFNTIATAQSGINSFKYANAFEINESRTEAKPMMMLQKQRRINIPDFSKNYKEFQVTFGIYDNYKTAEKSTKTYANKQKDLELLMEQFIRELRSRSIGSTTEATTSKDWFINNSMSMELIEVIGADKLVGIESTITIRVFNDCNTGTFSY
mgnify:FL=1